jgi:hypothetical protein
MDNQERIDKLYEAQEMLQQAIDLINEAYKGKKHSYDVTLVLQSIEIAASGEHSYLTRDPSIDDLVSELLEEDSELEEAE